MTNYQTAIKRIHQTKTSLGVKRLTRDFANYYELGFFTEKEFIKLDYKLLDQLDAILNEK
tara:strand:- start:70 stop:249 length:180 start_codon:yes stop_codon:yes gene_type:complete